MLHTTLNSLRIIITLFCAFVLTSCQNTEAPNNCADKSLCIDSLKELSIDTLRTRSYETTFDVIQQLGDDRELTPYAAHYSKDGTPTYPSYMLSYDSDGLRLYARVDIPVTTMPETGFPVLVFAHGWVGIKNAPSYDLGYSADSYYGELIDTYVDAGYIVITPGFRGHGTVNGQPADGIEYMRTWDNGSYLMPVFYAIDLLNLVSGLEQLNFIDWKNTFQNPVKLNLGFINLLGHSQGGDVALTALAISGEGSSIKHHFNAASIWAGNIPDRFTQASTFGAMASTLQAFMSGDGSWTGTATGQDRSVNPDFIFPWPSDSIATLDPHSEDWIWQAEKWSSPSVEDAVTKKYQQMYDTLNKFVRDIDSAEFEVHRTASGRLQITHPQEIAEQMDAIGGFYAEQYLHEPLALHFSDRDYYSFPSWNRALAERVKNAGGQVYSFEYPGNTHSLKLSNHEWFSPPGTKAGFKKAIQRDLTLFSRQNPVHE